MRQKHSAFLLAFSFLCLFALNACAKNSIQLGYTPSSQEIIPIVGAPSVCIVTFSDERPETAVGVLSDGKNINAENNVADWVTQAFGSEFARLGYIVTTAPTLQQAERNKAEYIITGKVEDVWLTQESSILYNARINISVSLLKANKVVFKHSYNAVTSESAIPFSNPAKEILAKTLAEVTRPLALAIQEKITK